MNFDFMMECEIKDSKIKTAYDEIYKELVEAEAHYWRKPQQCGILFRKTAEQICRFYNDYYEIGFPEGTYIVRGVLVLYGQGGTQCFGEPFFQYGQGSERSSE